MRDSLKTDFDPAKHSPIEIAQRLLKALDLSLECFERRRIKEPGQTGAGTITRHYRLNRPACITHPIATD